MNSCDTNWESGLFQWWRFTFISLWLHYKYEMQEVRADAEKQNMIVANFPSDELQIADLYKVGRCNL